MNYPRLEKEWKVVHQVNIDGTYIAKIQIRKSRGLIDVIMHPVT